MKNEYQNAADVKVEKIVISINIIINDEEDEWENDATDNIWEKWTRKTDTKRKCASSMYTDIVLFVESQYIKILKQI